VKNLLVLTFRTAGIKKILREVYPEPFGVFKANFKEQITNALQRQEVERLVKDLRAKAKIE